MAKVTFKEVCIECFYTNDCEDCEYRKYCDKEIESFLKVNKDKITKLAEKENVYCVGDISCLLPCEFFNYDTGEFIFSEEIGEMEIEYETNND